MQLNEFFSQLADTYDRTKDFNDAHEFVWEAPSLLAHHVPLELDILATKGIGRPTLTPWVAILDPDETDSTQEGIYVVYILSEDKQVLNLFLGQGYEYLYNQLGSDPKTREILSEQAETYRNHLLKEFPDLPSDEVDLRSKGRRQKAYEASSISSLVYEIAKLPDEDVLTNDLNRMLIIYSYAVEIKKHLLLTQPGRISSPTKPSTPEEKRTLKFKPTNADDYLILTNKQGPQKRTRKHEKLVNEFANYAESLGFELDNTHPRDLYLQKEDKSILIEAKMVYGHDSRNAVRSALGQLFDYRYFLYTTIPLAEPKLIALFSEPVGEGYVSFLETHGIGTIHYEYRTKEWVLSSLAEEAMR